MPPPLLFDLSKIDLDTEPVYDRKAVENVNPQQFEMQQLDGILWCDREGRVTTALADRQPEVRVVEVVLARDGRP